MEHIDRARRRIDKDEANERARHEKALGEIRNRRLLLEKQCPHPDPEFYADPAGGSDSHHSCAICGASW